MCLATVAHDMLQSSVLALWYIYHISNVNGVLQYTRITALYDTSVIFLLVHATILLKLFLNFHQLIIEEINATAKFILLLVNL